MATATVAGDGRRDLLLRGLASATAVASLSSAQQLATYSVPNVPDWQQASVLKLQISVPNGGIYMTFDVAPFTRSAGLTLSGAERGRVNLRGPMVVATESSYTDITRPEAIAYLSCDRSNTTKVPPETMLARLIEEEPMAIVLYAQSGNCCGLDGVGDNAKYQSIYTMTNLEEASETLNITSSGNGDIQATITGNYTTPEQDSAANQSGNNSAVAMSILYSITGLITLLFLIIIGTGAIRAHRYPERYGPRSGYGGRPRQSRAKGIARAVLETLPIVKFGTPPADPKADPALELEDGSGSGGDDRRIEAGSTATTTVAAATAAAPGSVQVHHLSTIPEDTEAHPKRTNTPIRESRVSPPAPGSAVAVADSGSQSSLELDEHLGCSICTEDFSVGEDVRVLPCNHKFHPPCIDPWLVNVSGTCPLCRLDLRPTKSNSENDLNGDGDGSNDATTPLPPPLEDDGDREAHSTTNRRRSSRFFDLNRLRHASAEERIEVLRRYRTESRTAGDAVDAEEVSRTSRLTHRLRERFRIRTRAQSPNRRRVSYGGGQIS